MRAIVLLALLAWSGCASGPRVQPARTDIENFGRVNERLYRGAQPDQMGMETLARMGIKTIINLRMPDDVWPTEEAKARAMGITYTNVPMSGWRRPTDEQIAKVLLLVETAASPVFIHCKRGRDRTGTVIACYRIQHDQWTDGDALLEAKQYKMSGWSTRMIYYVRDFAKAHQRD